MRLPGDGWRRRLTTFLTITVVACAPWTSPSYGASDPPRPPSPAIDSYADGDAVRLIGNESAANERAAADPHEASAPTLVEYKRSDPCDFLAGDRGLRPCTAELRALRVPDCGGAEPVMPLLQRTRASASAPWSAWEMVVDWTCPDAAPVVMTQADFRRLPIAPSALHIQPDRPEVLVNKPTIVYTDPTPQTFTPTLLGQPLEVQATPTAYTWDFGDHTTPITTTSPGHPYPDHDIAHPYESLGTYTITLTTTWSGRYRPAGTTAWQPVTGTATTTTTSPPITTLEAPTHLVTTDCHHHPHAPDC